MSEKELDSSVNEYEEQYKSSNYVKQLQWDMAIGLQEVDNLKPSKYLEKLLDEEVEGNLTIKEVEKKLKLLKPLDTTITNELREEGHVREIISKIQNMRKENGFEVLDRITLYLANNDMLMDVVKKFEDTIKKDTLTEKVVYGSDKNYVDTVINGENLGIIVEKI